MLEVTELPVRPSIVAERRPPRRNRVCQHRADRCHQRFHLLRPDIPGQPERRDPCPPERLANIDVAEPCHHPLVEQNRLYRRDPTGKPPCETWAVKPVAERLRPQPRQQAVRLQISGRPQIDHPEAAWVIERHPRPAGHLEDHVVVLLRRRVLVMKHANLATRHQHSPRHAEVQDQRLALVQVRKQVFRPSPQSQHPDPRQSLRQSRRKRPAQIRPPDLGARDQPTRQHRLKPASNRLDFRKFRHPIPPRPGVTVAARSTCLIRSGETDRKTARMADERTTHFGYETVPEADKAARVHGVFASVAARYDLMNDAMSGGVHRLWKDAMLDWLAPRPGMALLDVAGGTGDIAFRYLRRVNGQGHATVLDMTEDMLTEGRKRAEATTFAGSIDWVVGDAMALPFADARFDAYTISFGIRNVTRIEAALAEAYRVLKPGGRLLVLEFSRVPEPSLRWLYDRYSFTVIPALGQALAGDRASYQYLVESIRRFPDQDTFAAMITAAGFGQVRYRNLSMGIAALHSGWKI